MRLDFVEPLLRTSRISECRPNRSVMALPEPPRPRFDGRRPGVEHGLPRLRDDDPSAIPAMITNSRLQMTLTWLPSGVKQPSRLAMGMTNPTRMLKRAPCMSPIHLGSDACTRLTSDRCASLAQAWQPIQLLASPRTHPRKESLPDGIDDRNLSNDQQQYGAIA